MRRRISYVVSALSIIGLIAVVLGILSMFVPANHSFNWNVACLTVVFAALSPWAVRLQSGSAWRPGMAIVISTIFLLPPQLAIIVPLPGLLLVNTLNKQPLRRYLLTVGHVSAGIYAGALTYSLIAPSAPLRLPAMLPGAIAALAAYLLVNRAIAAIIVAERDVKGFAYELRLVFRELSWGHFSLYIVSLATALLFQSQGVYGLLLAAALLFSVGQSVSYYSRLQTLQKAVWTDGLTGAENRAAWDKFAKSTNTIRPSGTLAMIDVDEFKSVNDTHGHLVGDSLLRDLAVTLQRELRHSARLFRYGGDEFVLFIPHDASAADEVADRVTRILETFQAGWEERGLHLRASVGMSFVPADAMNLEEILQRADERMYADKFEHRVDDHSLAPHTV